MESLTPRTPFWGIEKTYTRYNPAPIPDRPSRSVNPVAEHVADYRYENKVPRDGGKGITIYILENSFTPEETALIDVSADRLRYLPNHTYPKIKTDEPYDIHGNLVVNIAGGTTFGAAPMASIVPVNIIGGDVDKAYSDILTDVLERELQGRAILSISKGANAMNVQPHLQAYEAITNLLEHGVIIVAAAGNDSLEVHRQDRNNMPQYYQEYVRRLTARKEMVNAINKDYSASDKSALAQGTRTAGLKKANELVDNFAAAVHSTNLRLPAAHPGVIAVGGCDETDACEQFAHGTGVDIYAPAFRIPYFCGNGTIVDTRPPSSKDGITVNGTSYATPFTAGTIATMMSEHYKQTKFGSRDPWKQQDIIETLYALARWTPKGDRYLLCYPNDKTSKDIEESKKNWKAVKDSCSKLRPLRTAA